MQDTWKSTLPSPQRYPRNLRAKKENLQENKGLIHHTKNSISVGGSFVGEVYPCEISVIEGPWQTIRCFQRVVTDQWLFPKGLVVGLTRVFLNNTLGDVSEKNKMGFFLPHVSLVWNIFPCSLNFPRWFIETCLSQNNISHRIHVRYIYLHLP